MPPLVKQSDFFDELSAKEQGRVMRAIDKFLRNTKHKDIYDHSLKNVLSNYRSFSADSRIRIIYRKVSATIYFEVVGNHDVYVEFAERL
jgi:mRNA-degrading endonuclease YafQ of YafQ-DinJ toxin-antitoxin module